MANKKIFDSIFVALGGTQGLDKGLFATAIEKTLGQCKSPDSIQALLALADNFKTVSLHFFCWFNHKRTFFVCSIFSLSAIF